MGLRRLRGFGGSVRPVWISGFAILVGVRTLKAAIGLTHFSITVFSENIEGWILEVTKYGERCGDWE